MKIVLFVCYTEGCYIQCLFFPRFSKDAQYLRIPFRFGDNPRILLIMRIMGYPQFDKRQSRKIFVVAHKHNTFKVQRTDILSASPPQ